LEKKKNVVKKSENPWLAMMLPKFVGGLLTRFLNWLSTTLRLCQTDSDCNTSR